jgi:hypothetical protein
MLLSLQDAADRLGKTRRQLRYMIQTQRIQAVKTAGRWMIEADDLPLSGPQRQAVDRRERQLQAAVERGLGLDEGSRRRRWSVRDLKAVQVALPLYRHCAAGLGTDHPASRYPQSLANHQPRRSAAGAENEAPAAPTPAQRRQPGCRPAGAGPNGLSGGVGAVLGWFWGAGEGLSCRGRLGEPAFCRLGYRRDAVGLSGRAR